MSAIIDWIMWRKGLESGIERITGSLAGPLSNWERADLVAERKEMREKLKACPPLEFATVEEAEAWESEANPAQVKLAQALASKLLKEDAAR